MSAVGIVTLIAIFVYVAFFILVFVLDEQFQALTELAYVAGLPAFWLGLLPLVGILMLLEKCGWQDKGTGDHAFLFFYVFGSPIGWGIIIFGTWVVQYLVGNYNIVPVQ